jgi:hypothetical protein
MLARSMQRLLMPMAMYWMCLRLVDGEREQEPELEWPIRRRSEPIFKWKADAKRKIIAILEPLQARTEPEQAALDELMIPEDNYKAGKTVTQHQIDLLNAGGVIDLRTAGYEDYSDLFERTLPQNPSDLTPAERHQRREVVNNAQREDIERQERLAYFPWLNEESNREGKDRVLKPVPKTSPSEVRATVKWSSNGLYGDEQIHDYDPTTGASHKELRYTRMAKLADESDKDADAYAEKVDILEGAARRAVAKANDMNRIVKDHVHLINRANRAAVLWNNEARQEHLDTVEHFADQVHGEKWETIADQLLDGFHTFGTPEEQDFLDKLLKAPQ